MKRVLVIDVGGTNIKVAIGGRKVPIKIPSGKRMTPARMAAAVRAVMAGEPYDVVSIGYPGPVKRGRPAADPHNLGGGWRRFNYRRAFKKPVKIVNDAVMQAIGSYEGGRMLFLGLGTGLGSAFIADGVALPLELAHMPYRSGDTYEDYVGQRGLDKYGFKKWKRHVHRVVAILAEGLQADYVVLGGGQTKKLKEPPPGAQFGNNQQAMLGGERLWRRRQR
jgi:polyphosphate glucokinase